MPILYQYYWQRETDLNLKLCSSREWVVDSYGSTTSAVTVCMLLTEHRWRVCGDEEYMRCQDMLSILLEL